MVNVLVVYDISDDKSRLKVARLLQSWGLSRIQRSAFMGRIPKHRLKDLGRALDRLIDEETDIVHIVPLQPRDLEATMVLGKPHWARRVLEGVALI